jgi:hypothetical protein
MSAKKEKNIVGNEILQYNKIQWRKKLQISCATEGWIRYEWAAHRYGQVIPVNWQASGFDVFVSMGYNIDDAYNSIVNHFITHGSEWLLLIEYDVLIPHDCFLKMGEYIDSKKYPIVSGLYYTKSSPAVPLIFRGRGNGAFGKWKLGSKVMCDGVPMGCLLIHGSILSWFYENSPDYIASEGSHLKKVFETPRRIFYDPEIGVQRQEGTQDLFWCDRLLNEDVLRKTGWAKLAKKKYPIMCDTSILCKHIDRNTGRQYP